MTIYDISVLRGNEFKGATFTVVINGVPMPLAGAQIDMYVKADINNAVPLLTIALGSGLTITNAAAGEFRLDPQVFNLPAGEFVYDIRITTGGAPYTYIKGQISILKVVTWT